MITDQYGIPAQVDGILGLTQGREPREDVPFPQDFEIGPLYMDYLALSGWITEKSFSTHFEGFSGSSYVDFGPVNYQSLASMEFYVELGSEKGFFYSFIPEGIRFGDADTPDIYKLQNKLAVLSSSMSVSMVPQSLSEEFFRNLLYKIPHVEDNGVFYVDCDVDRPRDVFMLIQGRWLHFKGDDMVVDISNTQDMTLCIINWLPSVDDFWVLGNSLYKDYYVTHKPDEAIVAFTPTEKQRKEPLRKGFQPETLMRPAYNWFMFLAKFLTAACIGVSIWAIAEYGFVGQTWTGLTFLNNASLKKKLSKEAARKAVNEQLKNMDATEITELITRL